MSVKFDVKSKLGLAQSLAPQSAGADVNGDGVDTQDSVGVGVVAHVGAAGITFDGTNFLAFRLEESDDNAAFTAVADADVADAIAVAGKTGVFAQLAAGESEVLVKGNYLGAKRYIRIVADFEGTHASPSLIAAHVVLKPQHQPGA